MFGQKKKKKRMLMQLRSYDRVIEQLPTKVVIFLKAGEYLDSMYCTSSVLPSRPSQVATIRPTFWKDVFETFLQNLNYN